MKIELITVKHPKIKNRDITFLLVNNKLDLPSAKYLMYESYNGGRNGSISSKSSHKNRAIKIKELYRHLNDMGLTWDTAFEFHIKAIRNAMLCWDNNGNKSYQDYEYKAIANDTMNSKLGTWYKFYRYMEKININCNMIMTTKKIKMQKKYSYNMLGYLTNRNQNNLGYIEVWSLMVKHSPRKHTYHALSRKEFYYLYNHLKNEDIVYSIITLLMVETGLRVGAALKVKHQELKGLFRNLNSGKSINDVVPLPYLEKDSEDTIKYCDLPLRTILNIQNEYLSRIYLKRKKLYDEKNFNSKNNYNKDVLWILENGKELKYSDLIKVYKKISNIMGFITNNITPHWMRHTFATWTLLDFAKNENIPIKNTGVTPNPLFILLLSQKLGHVTIESTMKYIATALKLMGVNKNNGPILISLDTLKKDFQAQQLIKKEAEKEFANYFDEKEFDVFKYAMSREMVVDS